jgi:hypothetical protein
MIGQNRKSLHRNAKTGSGGIGIFVKQFVYEIFNIDVLDQSFEGILWAYFNHNRIGSVMTSDQHDRLVCRRSWIRCPIGSNQRLQNWYLLLLR